MKLSISTYVTQLKLKLKHMANDVLTRVKIALGLMEAATDKPATDKVSCAVEAVTVDGTKIGADAFEPGNPLYTIAEDGTATPCAEGKYETADMVITCDANGMISAVEPKAAAAPAAAEDTQMKTDETPAEDKTDTGGENPKTDVDAEFKKAVMEALQALAAEISNINTKMEEIQTNMKMNKEQIEKFAKAPGAEKIKKVPSLHEFGKEKLASIDKKMEILKEINKGLRK